jgi:Maintenance of mitochondrial structure and function
MRCGQMQKYNERPLYLMLDPSLSQSSRDLPLTLYEETIHVLSSATSSDFTRIPYTVHADEAERITSFHCAKLTSHAPQHSSHVVPHYSTLHKAASSLHQRLLLIQRFLDDTAAGVTPVDHAVLREVKGLMRRMPVGEGGVRGGERGREMVGEYTDSLLLIELGVLTKALESVQEMNSKFAVLRTGVGGGEGRGLAGQQRGKRGSSGLMSMMGMAFDD